jgi:parvulin-like peptidyl-prolyl isomerase
VPGDEFEAKFPVTLSFKEKFPDDITTGIPSMTVGIVNRSGKHGRIILQRIALRKREYSVESILKGTVISMHEVKPFPSRKGRGIIDLKPDERYTFEFRLSDYFLFKPGEYDISAVFLTGAFRIGHSGNTSDISVSERVKIARGIVLPSAISGTAAGKPVAFVNEIEITEAEFTEKLKEVHGWELLEKMVAEKVVWEELKKQNITISPADIAYAIEVEKKVVKDRAPGVPFDQYLQTMGTSEAELGRSKGFLIRIAIRKFLSAGIKQPDERELMKFFRKRYHWYGREEMVQARKIVITPDEKKGKVSPVKAREDALATLLTIKKEIEDGRISFEDAVLGYSEDVRARVSGGLMDPFRAWNPERTNDVPRAVAEAGFRLKPGQISTPLEGEEGELMIIRIENRLPEKKALFKDVKDNVKIDYLYDAISGEQMQEWISGLVETATVKVTREYDEIFRKSLQLEKLKHYEMDLIKEE